MSGLLDDLTPEQREAATHVDGPLLIIAGAGSGKTRVITRRVAWLMGQGIAPSSILAITFTNKAAGEMKSRVATTLGRPLRDFGRLDQRGPLICTFHSLCLRILKHYAQQVGLAPNFSIYDTSDQERLIKEAIKACDLSPTNFQPGAVQNVISTQKNKLVSVEAYAATAKRFPDTHYARIYAAYQRLLNTNNALDFDDLLLRTAFVMRDHPEILKELQERFQYLLIDEYQDTNHAQYLIAHALAAGHNNICVVGDPDQSIYAWRGADIQNILDFEKDYPAAKVVKLERNYRSTQRILDIASAVIENNRRRKKKGLFTENPAGDKASLLVCLDEETEAITISEQLRQLQRQGFAWNQMAVFYRINALSRAVEDALRRGGIPYRVARGVDFYHRKEIKDVLAYLRVIANPNDAVSLERIVNVPARGLGDTGLGQIRNQGASRGWSLWQGIENAGQLDGLNPRTAKAAELFAQLVKRFRNEAAQSPLSIRELMESVVKLSGLEAHYQKLGGQEQAERANINELITTAAKYDEENPEGTLDQFLNQISLVSDVDLLTEGGGAVTLMTLHAAKGLEFPVVAMVGMEEGALPHARVREHPDQLEEERRLCFVGITRAQKVLLLSRSLVRRVRGVREPMPASRFLAEMPPEHLEVIDTTGRAGQVPGEAFLDEEYDQRQVEFEESESLAMQFRRGQLVRHQQFGVGRIMDIASMGAQTRAVVEFSRAGRKTLILQYAKLEPLG